MKYSLKHSVLKTAMLSGITLAATTFSASSFAVQSTGTFGVSATVAAECTISGTAMVFGTVSAFDAHTDQTSTLTATCTNGSPYTIGLNAGGGTGATVTDRKMTSGTDLLNYGLFTETTRATNWPDIGVGAVAGTGNGAGQPLTVYGRIPTGQNLVPVGNYTDTITATIDF